MSDPELPMSDEPLQIETDPSRRDVHALDHRLYAFNVAETGCTDGDELGIFVRDADGGLRGGLYGWTWGGWLEVRALWVREDERGRGLGSRLLAAAEEEGRRRGAHTAILETHSFQAPDFYARHGYVVYARHDGYPPGHSKLYLKKRIDAG